MVHLPDLAAFDAEGFGLKFAGVFFHIRGRRVPLRQVEAGL
jgi:hypothetical protein